MNGDIPGNSPVRARLHQLVQGGRAVAFVGAGASAPLYPLWGELLDQLIQTSVAKGLATADDARVWRSHADKRPQQVVRGLRDKLGDGRLGNLLADLFRTRRGPDDRTFTPVQGALLRANFRGFITTNYDPGLLEARLAVRPGCTATGFATWKDELVHHWHTGDIFRDEPCPVLFAHGIHQRPDTIVLGIGEYRVAYQSGTWRRCFDALWTREHLVFVGFGFSDPYLDFLVDDVLTQTAATSRGEPRHIAILPLQPGEAYSPEARRLFQDQYNADVLFYRIEQRPDGSLDFTTPLLRELDTLAPSSLAGTLSASAPTTAEWVPAPPAPVASPDVPPFPSGWIHETTEDTLYRGRRDALDRLHRWCSDPSVRLIALTALGGLGKTSLVGHWLKHEQGWTHRKFDGLFFWSFYNERDVDALLAGLLAFAAEKLGVPPPVQGTPLVNAARALLRRRPLLLVLDGLEVLQELADSPQYGALLDLDLQALLADACGHGGGLVVLTSRFPFPDLSRFYGLSARGFDLPPLTPEDGAQLLEACGVAGRLEDRQAVSVEFDGHPLALRVFAAACQSLDDADPNTLRHRLSEAVQSAPEDGELSDEERRARTLRRLLTFYEQRLPVARRHLLGLVALFRTPVETQTLRELARKLPGVAETFAAASDADIDRHLAVLAHEHLLLRQPGRARGIVAYTAHPILRDYFRTALLGGRGELARGFADVVAGQPSSGRPQSVQEIEPVLDAIEVLLEAGDFKRADELFQGRLEHGRLFQKLPAPHAGLRCALGFVVDSERQGQCRKQIDVQLLVIFFTWVGIFAGETGEFGIAMHFLEKSLDLKEKEETSSMNSNSFQNLAGVLTSLGDLTSATTRAAEALRLSRSQENLFEITKSLCYLADALSTLGNLELASQHFTEADSHNREDVDQSLSSRGGQRWSWHLTRLGNHQRSKRLTEANRKISERNGWNADIARCETLLGVLALSGGDPATALEHLAVAEAILRPARQIIDLPSLLLAQAECARKAGQPAEAAAKVDEALSLSAPRGMKLAHADALVFRARLRLDVAQDLASTPRTPDPHLLARDDAEGALQLAHQCGYVWAERDALELLVEICHALGDRSSAEAHARDLTTLTDRLDREIAAGRKVTDEHFAKLESKTGATTQPKPKRGRRRKE